MKTALYRHFNATGDLLYVGISLSAVQRLSQHMSSAGWAEKIARVTVEWFDTREEAEAAERQAIKAEKPVHNVMHAGKPAGALPLERNLTNTMICWTSPNIPGDDPDPMAGRMALVRWPDTIGASRSFAFSAGACDLHVGRAMFEERRLWLMCNLVTIMLRDGIKPAEAHRACLPLPEYRASLPPDAFTKQERERFGIEGDAWTI